MERSFQKVRSCFQTTDTDNFPRISAFRVRKQSLEDETPIPFYGHNREPIVITSTGGGYSGLGGSIPPPSLTVKDVARLVGPERMVDVIGRLQMRNLLMY